MHFLQTNRFKSIRICSITNRELECSTLQYTNTRKLCSGAGHMGSGRRKSPSGGFGGEAPPPPKAHTILPVRIFGCQTMQNFVYLAKRYEPLAKHKKNLGCSSCLFAELSIDKANNYSCGVRCSHSAPIASSHRHLLGVKLGSM